MLKLKYTIFILVLVYAGFYDVKKREIPDKVHLIILATSSITNFSIIKSLIGLIFISIPFVIPIYFDYNSVGGGDIKLSGAIGFFLGLKKGLISLIVGLTLALVFNKLIFRKKGKEIFPLAPYMAIGSIISLIV